MRHLIAWWTVGSLVVGAGDLGALTIYRVGGVDQPAPELASVEGVEFVQIDWADIDEDLHGSINLLEVTSSHIEPRQLDPTVNLTPLLPQTDFLGDILYLTWIGWGGFDDDDELIWDEDPNTALSGRRSFRLARAEYQKPDFRFWRTVFYRPSQILSAAQSPDRPLCRTLHYRYQRWRPAQRPKSRPSGRVAGRLCGLRCDLQYPRQYAADH